MNRRGRAGAGGRVLTTISSAGRLRTVRPQISSLMSPPHPIRNLTCKPRLGRLFCHVTRVLEMGLGQPVNAGRTKDEMLENHGEDGHVFLPLTLLCWEDELCQQGTHVAFVRDLFCTTGSFFFLSFSPFSLCFNFDSMREIRLNTAYINPTYRRGKRNTCQPLPRDFETQPPRTLSLSRRPQDSSTLRPSLTAPDLVY